MLAFVYHGSEDLRVEDVPRPEPAADEALLKVDACGICGTDLRISSGRHRSYPEGTVRIPGHEISGRVAAVGREARGLEEGQPAFVAPNIGCGRCPECRAGRFNLCVQPDAVGITRDGGFAEYLLLPASLIHRGNVLPFPEGLDAAPVSAVEPLACALRGSTAVQISPGDVVLVVGAGPIGLMHLMLARIPGPAAVVVSAHGEERRRQAESLGADRVIDPTSEDLEAIIGEVSDGRGADVVIVAAPDPAAQAMALKLAAPAGRVNFFGGLPRGASEVGLDTNLIHYKELLVTGTTANTAEDCRRALELLAGGSIDLDGIIDARYPVEKSPEAFEEAASGRARKVVIEP